MSKIRVLIVDDAVVVRKVVTDALTSDPDFEVCGTAANGKIAISKLTQVNPDAITLDVEMPEMNGIETLTAIRKTHPKIPIVMFSTLTERGASVTLDALAAGASDYVTKPSNVGNFSEAMDRLREELIPKLKNLCRKVEFIKSNLGSAGASMAGLSSSASKLMARSSGSFKPLARPMTLGDPKVDIVAIGCSTGGPNALTEVLSQFTADFPVPIVITQHMPPVFTRLLAERLQSKSGLKVVEAKPGDVLKPAHAYVAPGDYHMTLARELTQVVVKLNQDPPENCCRPAVDVMFRSVAEVYGQGTLGVILTGMGQDGLRGSERLITAGGHVIAQDEATSVVWGMPGYVSRNGLADATLPLSSIGPDIFRRVRIGRIIATRRLA